MKILWGKFLAGVFITLLILGFAYYYREDIGRFWQELFNKLQPCQKPIMYSIVSLDPRFGLTKQELLKNLKQAEAIWELPINKDLFAYSATGSLKISLIYDYRQEATDALKKMGIAINGDRSTYDALKIKYNSLIASYNKEKAHIESLSVAYNSAKSAFERDVNYWNSRGGAPKAEYSALEQRRAALDGQLAIINQNSGSLNELVSSINSTETILNKLVATLNLKVDKYNTVGSSAGKEFNEGEYIKDANGVKINIFEFKDKEQLLRVLGHEFGHALGLLHIDNPKAMMYYLNEGGNDSLATDDLAAIKEMCAILK
ncbi:MAG: matrixin family metalloprotease [bacterium]